MTLAPSSIGAASYPVDLGPIEGIQGTDHPEQQAVSISTPSNTPGTMSAPVGGAQVVVGQVVASHGVHGALKVRSFMQHPADLFSLDPVYLGARPGQPLSWTRHKSAGQPDLFIAQTTLFSAPEPIAAWKSQPLWVDRAALPNPDPKEVYYVDLVGLPLQDAHQKVLGQVIYVHDFGAGPILEVRYPVAGGRLDVQFVALADVEVHTPSHLTLKPGVPFLL